MKKDPHAKTQAFASVEQIDQSIVLIRGHRVMLDSLLAELYGVETKALNQAVRRNIDRFPNDFLFQLTSEEFEKIRMFPSHFWFTVVNLF